MAAASRAEDPSSLSSASSRPAHFFFVLDSHLFGPVRACVSVSPCVAGEEQEQGGAKRREGEGRRGLGKEGGRGEQQNGGSVRRGEGVEDQAVAR